MHLNPRSTLLLVALILLLASPVLINLDLFDEELRIEAAQVLEYEAPAADITDQALRLLANEADALNLGDRYTRCTARTQLGCLAITRADLKAHPVQHDAELQRLLLAYEEILGWTTYQGNSDPTHAIPSPYWGTVLQLGSIYLADKSMGQPADFVAAVARSNRFWGMVYDRGHIMIDKMVGVAALWTATQFSSEWLHTAAPSFTDLLMLIAALDPTKLNIDAMNIAYEHEFRVFAHLLEVENASSISNMSPLELRLASLLLQRQATLNNYYKKIIESAVCISRLPISQFRAAGDSCQPDDAMGNPIYNPAGKALVGLIGPLHDYLSRVHDLNGVAGLVTYQVEQRMGGESPPSEFVESGLSVGESPDELFFTCLDQHSTCSVLKMALDASSP